MSEKKDKKTQTRERILTEAKKIFAAKGFDGARVDEIAAAAEVNKALIYYYFKSKEEILEEIIERFLKQSLQRKQNMLEHPEEIDHKKVILSSADRIFNLFKGNEDILRIIIMEELKSEKKQWPLFQILDRGTKDGLDLAEELGFSMKDKDKLIRAAFYFGFIPIAFFCMLKDEWAKYYKTDPEEDKIEFIEILKKTYIRFLMDEMME